MTRQIFAGGRSPKGVPSESWQLLGYRRFMWCPTTRRKLFVEAVLEKRHLLDSISVRYGRVGSNADQVLKVVPVNFFAHAPPGTIFNERFVPLHFGKVEDAPEDVRIELDFSLENTSFVLGRNLPQNVKAQINSAWSGQFTDDLLFFVAKRIRPRLGVAVIPCSEIFRFFFTRSTYLLRHILDASIFVAEKEIWDIHLPQHPRGLPVIRWRKNSPILQELSYVARFALNPYAREQAENLILRAARTSMDRPGNLPVRPPVSAATLIASSPDDMFFCEVTYLHSLREECSWDPIPFFASIHAQDLTIGRNPPDPNQRIEDLPRKRIRFETRDSF